MKEVTIEKILEIINALDGITISSKQTEENLFDLGVDSILFIQIVVALEEAFDCEIPDSKLLITEMGTVRKIYGVLQEVYSTESIV